MTAYHANYEYVISRDTRLFTAAFTPTVRAASSITLPIAE